jgi:hypothetical protein
MRQQQGGRKDIVDDDGLSKKGHKGVGRRNIIKVRECKLGSGAE